MRFRIIKQYSALFIGLLLFSCEGKNSKSLIEENLIDYLDKQGRKTAEGNRDDIKMPVVIDKQNKQWTSNEIYNWRSGFWPGIEWYLYESTKDEYWEKAAEKSTEKLIGVIDTAVANHDLGFQFYCSYGNGYRLTGNPSYKQILLRAADSLATLYNPNVGTILSWPYRVKGNGWPHNTIIDNMMNLELLFWAAKNGGSKNLYDIAVKHAETTMMNHFRSDFSTYHVLVYDTITGKVIKRVTHQGYSDNSMWARGQAWAIYGFTMTYLETKKKEFLQTAMNAADIFLKRLPKDHIPYWDFDDPAIPNTPRDASAAAITASALLELSILSNDMILEKKYKNAAVSILNELSTDKYLSKEQNNAFLLHSTGNKPGNKDIDVPIIYADYYFIEALLRLKKMNK